LALTNVPDYSIPYGFGVSRGGMTLRDHFAAVALRAFCASESFPKVGRDSSTATAAAEAAYRLADAMMAARDGREFGNSE